MQVVSSLLSIQSSRLKDAAQRPHLVPPLSMPYASGSASAVPSDEGSAAALVEKADAALYAAKQAGRNQAK
jgi:GGDEF domain-containing protein